MQVDWLRGGWGLHEVRPWCFSMVSRTPWPWLACKGTFADSRMHAQVSKVGCPFRVVIIESSASEDHLRASLEVLESLAMPRRFPVGYRGFEIHELQLLCLPSSRGHPGGGEPKARAEAATEAGAAADGAAAHR